MLAYLASPTVGIQSKAEVVNYKSAGSVHQVEARAAKDTGHGSKINNLAVGYGSISAFWLVGLQIFRV